MNDTRVRAALALGLSLAAGLVLMGWFVGSALYRARAADRYATVRGFAEREVAVNLSSNDLANLQRRVEEFLKPTFPAEEWSTSAPRVMDRQAQGMSGEGRPLDRYVADPTVTVRTSRIDAAREAMRRSGDLVKQGVATQYLYTGLETIKPEMIAEATRDARRAAEQFAQDSGSRAGAIRNAQQGYCQIEDRDPFSPEFKKVRVVTTVQYLLAD
jgi:hypothetical protein